MNSALTTEQIAEKLRTLPGWTHADDALSRTFTFGSFKEAVSFMVRVAFEAEALKHHPEISNVYNRVDIRLTTHDAGNKVSDKDIELAGRIDSLSWV
ncbi:MAG: 4a-hydroxytetrahydrobiopterin dehydratase [Bacteroidetes bacterium CG12_big_fil_rev_8_21_14_0_65_60_17]|nr:MAG: 4a-hydroxytetrahydrobiopterin dehydratase [Bacteroidetes bacterium CG12_big_fil_rev_8_21_14_0_65_60_17]